MPWQAHAVVLSLINRLASRVLDLVRMQSMSQAEKDIEILVLRHQLQVSRRQAMVTATTCSNCAHTKLHRCPNGQQRLASWAAPRLPRSLSPGRINSSRREALRRDPRRGRARRTHERLGVPGTCTGGTPVKLWAATRRGPGAR